MGRCIFGIMLLFGGIVLGAQEGDLELVSPSRQGFRSIQASDLAAIAQVLAVNPKDFLLQNGQWVVVSPDPQWPRASSTLANDGYGPYDAAQASNGSSNGIWVEGVKGAGLGEWLAVRSDMLGDIISIYPGHPGTGWSKNNRLRSARIVVFGYQTTNLANKGQEDRVSTQLAVQSKIWECIIDFPDIADWRYLGLPAGLVESQYYVAVVYIQNVWAGSQYNDTCIAEFGMTFGQ